MGSILTKLIIYMYLFSGAENEYKFCFLDISILQFQNVKKNFALVTYKKGSFNQIQNPEVVLYVKDEHDVIFSFIYVQAL